MKKLIICVATYNHPEVISKVLKECIDLYQNMDVDIKIYDSSSNDKTKNLISKMQSKYDCIFYCHLSSDTNYGQKIQFIFQDRMLLNYKYFQITKDRSYIPSNTLRDVFNAMTFNPNVIFIDSVFLNKTPNGMISPIEFYIYYSCLATSLNTSIYRSQDYITDNIIYTQLYDEHWMQYDYLFNNLVNLNNVYVIKNKLNELNCPSLWTNKSVALEIWKDYWIDLNMKLPKEYDEYKLFAIKRGASWPWIYGSLNGIITSQIKNGYITLQNYKEKLKNLDKVSNISLENVEAILNKQSADDTLI